MKSLKSEWFTGVCEEHKTRSSVKYVEEADRFLCPVCVTELDGEK